jgi:Fic family protein
MYIEKAFLLKAELDKLRPINKEQEERIMQKFRLDWDYHSNHLEGNTLTFGETKALILFGITAQGKPLKDHLEITGHDEAIKWIIDVVKKDRPLTETFIRELHILLLKEPYQKEAFTPDGQKTTKTIKVGEYKHFPNHVETKTGEMFYFASPEETPALMEELINWYRKEKELEDVNPILLASEFHYKFIRIHPFDDGNGRTARILMNFILMEFDYPPVIIKTEDKLNYFAVLRQADADQLEPFIEYIAQNLTRSLEIMIAGAKGGNIEDPDDLDKQIALLSQKVKTTASNIEILRDRKSILELYDGSLVKLLEAFIETCEKFKGFYKNIRFNIHTAESYEMVNNSNDLKTVFRQKINNETKGVILNFQFLNFNQIEIGESGYDTKLEINFDIREYSISVPRNFEMLRDDNMLNNTLKSVYGIQLSDQKIKDITNYEFNRHKDSIEKMIKKAQERKA